MTLDIVNAGVGYTPSSGHFTFTGVAMTSLSGHGINAQADIHIEGGGLLDNHQCWWSWISGW